jgi:nitric oxide reductase subunit B
MKIPQFSSRISPAGKAFFILSAITFLASALIGIIASVQVGIPSRLATWTEHVDLTVLRPIHTMFSIVGMIAGGMGISVALVETFRKTDRAIRTQWASFHLLVVFTLVATITLGMEITSGREYISWVSPVSLPLIASIVTIAYVILRKPGSIIQASPEGMWLHALGWILIALGLVEVQGYHVPFIFRNGVRDLTQQWHGIDIIIAGLNVVLYSGMLFLLQKKPKPLRKRWMFAIATFGLLGTFGHHHYISPQPVYLKWFAFLASMVAVLSFLRHIRGYRKEIGANNLQPDPIMPLLLSAEFWTIVAVGSGIIFAIPQINFYVHGTYLIVVHAMGSMIGINVLIIIAAGLLFMRYQAAASESAIKWGVRMVNLSLVLLWVGLGIPSIMKGIMRVSSDYQSFHPVLEPWYMLFPLVGLLLLAGLFVLLSEVIWVGFGKRPTAEITDTAYSTESNSPNQGS